MSNKDPIEKEYDRWLERSVIIIVGIIVIGILVFKTNLIFVTPDKSHHYTDVADWVQDVQSHVPDSELRHTFVASVYDFMSDNVITDKEYRIIRASYNDLKQSIAVTSIHDNIKLMRAPNEFSLLTPRLSPKPASDTADINK